MGIKDLKAELENEVDAFLDPTFTHQIIDTKHVPDLNDPEITYPSVANLTQKSKRLTSVVLFVDMRGSTAMSFKHQDMTTLAPVYSTFVRSMSKCAHHYGGKVRNIIGDRVMVVFDRKDCFKNAANTAILMNSIVQYVLNAKFKDFTIEAGIGMDFGQMLVTKNGVIRQGDENDPNKALVWLGKPANVASKLTDIANKTTQKRDAEVTELHHFEFTDQWHNFKFSVPTFMGRLKNIEHRLTHEDESCYDKVYSAPLYTKNPPILFTQYFYDNYVKENPEQSDITKQLWKETDISIPGYPNKIMGGQVIFTELQ